MQLVHMNGEMAKHIQDKHTEHINKFMENKENTIDKFCIFVH